METASKDQEHLRLLALFHFIKAGLSAVGLLFLFMHFLLFYLMFTGSDLWTEEKTGVSSEITGKVFGVFELLYLVLGVALALGTVLNLLSAMFLRARKHRAFSLMVSILNCLNMPLGTILGVFTIVVLMRSSVRDSYRK